MKNDIVIDFDDASAQVFEHESPLLEEADIGCCRQSHCGRNFGQLLVFTIVFLAMSAFVCLAAFSFSVICGSNTLTPKGTRVLLVASLGIAYCGGIVLLAIVDDHPAWLFGMVSPLAVKGFVVDLGYLGICAPWVYMVVAIAFGVIIGILAIRFVLFAETKAPAFSNAIRDVIGSVMVLGIALFLAGHFAVFSREYTVADDGWSIDQEQTLAQSIETAGMMLNQEEWESLSVREKADCAAKLVVVEANYLGIDVPTVKVQFTCGGALSSYEKDTNTVIIEMRTFSRSGEVVALRVCHECAHAAEWCAVQGKLPEESELRQIVDVSLDEVADWEREFQSLRSTDAGGSSAHRKIDGVAYEYEFFAFEQIKSVLQEEASA